MTPSSSASQMETRGVLVCGQRLNDSTTWDAPFLFILTKVWMKMYCFQCSNFFFPRKRGTKHLWLYWNMYKLSSTIFKMVIFYVNQKYRVATRESFIGTPLVQRWSQSHLLCKWLSPKCVQSSGSCPPWLCPGFQQESGLDLIHCSWLDITLHWDLRETGSYTFV